MLDIFSVSGSFEFYVFHFRLEQLINVNVFAPAVKLSNSLCIAAIVFFFFLRNIAAIVRVYTLHYYAVK
jgi:hypothetical protein